MQALHQRSASAASPPAGPQRRRRPAAPSAFRLLPAGGGAALEFSGQDKLLVGSGPGAGLQLAGLAAEHAEVSQKGKQVYVKALVGGESVFDSTCTWIDGVEARPHVGYVVASGAALAFGGERGPGELAFTVEFDQPSGANPLVEMMMQARRGAARRGPARAHAWPGACSARWRQAG
ncbi:hypothetical protein HT031_004950 [Scenedesmus sp. PABB004]|nr:hypothetical protein HT031_004950 [Scenedesmus sp. PABB004]